jgi:hypothetical protein
MNRRLTNRRLIDERFMDSLRERQAGARKIVELGHADAFVRALISEREQLLSSIELEYLDIHGTPYYGDDRTRTRGAEGGAA